MKFFPQNLYELSEGDLSKTLIDALYKKLSEIVKVDVAIVGAGPSGLTAAWKLGEKGYKVLVLERMLGVGGGMRGGSMLLPVGLIEDGEAAEIAREAGARINKIRNGLFVVDPSELAVRLASKAIENGAIIWPGVLVEDLITRGRGEDLVVKGVLINWTPIYEAGWHVDPFYIEANAVVDATGHDGSLLRVLAKRHPELKINIPGMSSQNVWIGEEMVVEKTSMVVKGLFVTGMSVAELYNTNRMGAIFGGMLVSGRKVADLIDDYFGKTRTLREQ
ncbi:sulfide-dependent adenosine diphosphate thiazole synthase [Staphylothermus hellenicus]|uniref:Thiamine thiazole synthase n=1 Tax=Staphylothermus hellenicus (strain DSM 12710 / JCM 10830 / BK20S6-10-b1 / P8) TaxID=591019 RepID=D7D7Y4_STAHD|nr:sulfide-dependent adenosine diphosphate thiazole synthase [Staphylothermus hellenicus]ADI31880.1 thiazole biosynthesis enzyme [Staphylothermus hellenicus DSM 12710]